VTAKTAAAKLRVLVALSSTHRALLGLFEACEVHLRSPGEVTEHLISQNGYHLILLENGNGLLSLVRAADPRAEIIVFGRDEDAAVEAVAKGASAYFTLPPDLERLRETISGITEIFSLRQETGRLEKLLQDHYLFRGVVARNPQMLEILNYMRRVAPYYRTITITGETGTGKEVIAKALHSLNPGVKGSFVVGNCGSFVEGLIESELFGHRKGAFTGAIRDSVGLFEAAGDGTVFLDEIGLLPFSAQPHLLRVLQSGEFRRVGSSQPSKAQCRVIAATNKDLVAEVKAGTFREDLFYRLTSLSIHLPPLRARKDDIPFLCRHFLDRFCKRTGKNIFGISRPAQSAMICHDWPGNVRELESVIEQAAILAPGSFIDVGVLPPALREEPHRSGHFLPASLDYVVQKHLEAVLAHCSGNRTQAAKMLGISRRALQRKLEKKAGI
jgi:DNA-binding NtrC family response regulator